MVGYKPERVGITFGKAVEDLRPNHIGPAVWSIFALHKPQVGPELPNRCILYAVKNGRGKSTLIVVNGVTPDLERDEPFGAIRRLAKELAADVGYIFNPGPEHHISLAHYAAAFPDARVLVAKGRIERENPQLRAMDNVETMPPGDAVPELAEQGFHVHVWDGLMEAKIANVVQGRLRARRGTAEPVMFHHEQSSTLLNGGHGWWYWGEQTALPWLARKQFKMRQGEVVWSPAHYRVFDEARCANSAARVLEWRFDTLLDLHAPLDDWMKSGAGEAVERLCRPMVDGNWGAIPFGTDKLGIPEGKVTGGDWKSYR